MEVWLLMTVSADSALPDHCEPSTAFLSFLSSHLRTCIPTSLAFISTVLGSLSIAAWLFAQLPQILKNYNLKSTSGLSIYFLVEWCFGDVTNLLGALFTQQAAWQVIVAAYYVMVDLMLVWQYAWYTHILPPAHPNGRTIESVDGANDRDSDTHTALMVDSTSAATKDWHLSQSPKERESHQSVQEMQNSIFRTPNYSLSPPPKEHDSVSGSAPRTIRRMQKAPLSPVTSPRTFLLIAMLIAIASAQPLSSFSAISQSRPVSIASTEASTRTAGRILSWCSTLLYLASRLPQLYKNHTRRSTAGLSAKLFIAAFFGNLFYSASLLTNPCAWADLPAFGGAGWAGPEGSNRADWLGRAAPFWLGAAGVLALDAAVGLQFLAFSSRQHRHQVIRDESGHWLDVSGWMRGWVPSISAKGGESGLLIPPSPESSAERSYGTI